MFKRFDESPAIGRFFEALTAALAKKRGLPVVIGIVLIVISFVLHLIEVFLPSPALEALGVTALHLGLLAALIGLLLAEALGR
ncbi:MAG: hypothetical protein BroJett033_0740 [Chloroflexota bacterium]|nr:MAG: hypothetical protein BroJett033_0740 [Chloroflexota bacterium]